MKSDPDTAANRKNANLLIQVGMFLLCVGIVFAVFLSLRSCYNSIRPDKGKQIGGEIDDSIVEVRDRSVLVAQPGTISRAIIDWFNDPNAPTKTFDIGWQPFVPESSEPAEDTDTRLDRFALEMHSDPDVRAEILVCSATRLSRDTQLARARAERLKRILADKRIEESRVAIPTCQPSGARILTTSPSEQDGEVIELTLSRSGR